jgi:hypothetical protein
MYMHIKFSLLHVVQTGCEVYTTSNRMDVGEAFPRDKAARE